MARFQVSLNRKFDRDIRGLDFECVKRCSGCDTHKDYDLFGRYKSGPQKGNLRPRCLECDKYENWGHMKPFVIFLSAVKNRAKRSGLSYDLDEHKDRLRLQFETGCELTGLPFDYERGLGRANIKWNAPSLDRIDSRLGYTNDNVRVVLWCLNAAFNQWGEDQFEIAARAWLARKEMSC